MSGHKRTISLSVLAEFDFEEIVSYSATEWGESRADQYVAMVNDALKSIERFPFIGAARNELMWGMRRLVVNEHSIFYRVEEGEIRIYRIVHVRLDLRTIRFERG